MTKTAFLLRRSFSLLANLFPNAFIEVVLTNVQENYVSITVARLTKSSSDVPSTTVEQSSST